MAENRISSRSAFGRTLSCGGAVPFDEEERLAELRSLDILDTPSDKHFDRFTRLMTAIFRVPMAAVSLVDEDRQWFKSSTGMAVCETPLENSFCVHALKQDMLEVPDTLEDAFFHHHPLVVADPFIRFYMGTVLRGPSGQPLGTLCIMDTQSRFLNRAQRFWLVTFGHLVENLINHDHARPDLPKDAPSCGTPCTERPFDDALGHLLKMSEKEGSYLAVLHLRLKNFDEIGLTHGRRSRDASLHWLTERLNATDNANESKVLAASHLKYDRFGAVIPLSSVRNLFDFITPILDMLTNPIEFRKTTILPDIDVGISLSPIDGVTSAELMEKAGAALDGPISYKAGHARSPGAEETALHEHEAKQRLEPELLGNPLISHYQSGPRASTAVHVYSHEAEKIALRRRSIEQRLWPALLGNRLSRQYQPQVATDGSRILGFEALVEWQDRHLGHISPEDFMPIAEKNARLSRLMTEWSIRTVCEKAKHWPAQPNGTPLRIAVNIPPGEFHQKGFVDRVLRTLDEHGMAPDRLTMELSEESLLANVDKATETMNILRDHNITIALDGFGTGYSSLSYLKNLPVDTLKIDKSFIDDLPDDSRSADLVSGIIRIAHTLELQVVAEGVEHEAQRRLLHEAGCDVIQGCLYSQPLLADDALALLKSWPRTS